MRTLIVPGIVIIMISGLLTWTTTALAQDSWTLTVNLLNVPFGFHKIYVLVKGPFGADLGEWVNNQINPHTTFTLLKNEFPSGYYFKICASTNSLGTYPCSTYMSTGNNQTLNWDFNSSRVGHSSLE
jgi:hypothetical protein